MVKSHRQPRALSYEDTQSIVRTHHRGLEHFKRYFGKHIGKAGELILDVGAGDSGFAEEVTKSASHHARVVRVDLDYIRVKPNYSKGIIAAPADQMPVASGTIDKVISCWMLPHIPRSKAAPVLREMFRVTKPKGKILLFPAVPFKSVRYSLAKRQKVKGFLTYSLFIEKPKDFDSWESKKQDRVIGYLVGLVTMPERVRVLSRKVMARTIKKRGTNRTAEIKVGRVAP